VNNLYHHNIKIPDISLETTQSYVLVSSSATLQSTSLSHHHELLGRIATLSLQADTRLLIRLLRAASIDGTDIACAARDIAVHIICTRCEVSADCISTAEAVIGCIVSGREAEAIAIVIAIREAATNLRTAL